MAVMRADVARYNTKTFATWRHNRVPPTETVFVLNATLTEYKLEDDSDYHVVLQDSGGKTMRQRPVFRGLPPMTFVAHARRCAARREANWNRFNYCSDTLPSRPQRGISEQSKIWCTHPMTELS
jgi:hypothetical protein